MPYLLFLKKQQNLKLSSAASYMCMLDIKAPNMTRADNSFFFYLFIFMENKACYYIIYK